MAVTTAPVPSAVNPVFDAAGNLYGTTREGGGLIYEGTVFELSRSGGGWTENILHRFDGGGSIPESGVLLDSAGNIYGTGTYPHGAIFQLAAGQNWDMTQLYIFTGGSDGSGPLTQLLPDAAGNLTRRYRNRRCRRWRHRIRVVAFGWRLGILGAI